MKTIDSLIHVNIHLTSTEYFLCAQYYQILSAGDIAMDKTNISAFFGLVL